MSWQMMFLKDYGISFFPNHIRTKLHSVDEYHHFLHLIWIYCIID